MARSVRLSVCPGGGHVVVPHDNFFIRPHRNAHQYKMRSIVTHVGLSVRLSVCPFLLFVGQSVCLLVTNVSPAKIVEPIEILFGCGLGGEKPYITWGLGSLKERGFRVEGILGHTQTYSQLYLQRGQH